MQGNVRFMSENSAVIDRDYQIDDKIPKKIKPRRLVEQLMQQNNHLKDETTWN